MRNVNSSTEKTKTATLVGTGAQKNTPVIAACTINLLN
jgi:hypothetical protein